jgi:chaperone LolA
MTCIKILLILFFPVFIYAQTAKELLTDMQAKYNSVKCFTADFNQNTKTDLQKEPFKSSGKIYFKKSNKFRIEMKDQLLISDGKTVWNHNLKQNKIIITNFDSEPSVLSLDKFILDYPGQCDASYTGDAANKAILLKPKKKNAEFKNIKIYPDSGSILSKVEFTDAGGNYFSFEFSNVKLDENLSDKQFSYTVPKGTRTVDLR